jgi:hypothetical protein
LAFGSSVGGGREHADEVLEGPVECSAQVKGKVLLRASLVDEITYAGLHQ